MTTTLPPRRLDRLAAILGVVCGSVASSAALSGCVAVPPEVRAEYADDDGVRPNHFRLRPEASRVADERAVFERAERATEVKEAGEGAPPSRTPGAAAMPGAVTPAAATATAATPAPASTTARPEGGR